MKELYVYAPIFSYSAEVFNEKLNAIDPDEEIKIRLNTPGGKVFAGWSMIAKMLERTGKTWIAIDGHAASMGFIFAAMGEKGMVSCLDVSRFMVHRAVGYVENDADQKMLDEVNSDLKKALKAKLDLNAFKEVAGMSLDQLFKAEERIDIQLTAKEAKKIGLVDRIDRLQPKQLKAYTQKFVALYDVDDSPEGDGEYKDVDLSQGSEQVKDPDSQGSDEGKEKEITKPKTIINKTKTSKKMTKDELRSENPALYNEIYGDGKKFGESEERNRVNSWLAFVDIDKENVIKAVKEGSDFTTAITAEMMVKMTATKEVDKTKKDAAGNIITDAPDGKTTDEKDVEAFGKKVKEGINLENIM